jgi:hypothetical protein
MTKAKASPARAPQRAKESLSVTGKNKQKKSKITKAEPVPSDSVQEFVGIDSMDGLETLITVLPFVIPNPVPPSPDVFLSLLKNKEIKKLLDMGLQRGYLTFVEVNELLPLEFITPEQVDQILFLLQENEIEVLESQQAEIEELESKVDSVLAENVELKQVLKGIAKQNQIMEAADGLSEVEMERFVELAEELTYDNEEVFGKKLNVIREQFFSQTDDSKQLVESVVSDEPLVEEVEMHAKRELTEQVNPSIAALAAQLSRKSY